MRVQNESQVSVDELIAEKLPSVEKIVHQTARSFPDHVDREELYSAGCLGLVEAANRFDPSKGFSFSTWAEYRIKGAVLDYARSQDRLSQNNRRNARELTLATEELTAVLGRPPTAAELSKKLQWAPTKIQDVKRFMEAGRTSHRPIEEHVSGDNKVGVDTTAVSPEEHVEHDEMLMALRVSLSALSERQQQVVVGLYVDGLTTREVAERCGVSLSRVAQIRNETLDVLRDALTAHLSDDETHAGFGSRDSSGSSRGTAGAPSVDSQQRKSRAHVRSRDAVLAELRAAGASRPQRPQPPIPRNA